jgi:RNA polymerase sigma-70 factor, ECF subfamily
MSIPRESAVRWGYAVSERWLEPVVLGERSRLFDPRAERFELLFRNNFKQLVQTLSYVTFDRQTAEDAVQEAFARLYSRWDEVRAPDDAAGWLYTTALNRVIDERRAAGRFQRLLGSIGERASARAAAAWPEARPELVSAMRHLPLKQRTAAALFYLGDLSIAEVAGVMGVSEGSVNQHLNRARKALRTTLEVAP